MLQAFDVAILIVAYRNPQDVTGCLRSLARAQTQPSFEVYIIENGGPDAFDALTSALASPDSPCRIDTNLGSPFRVHEFKRVRSFRLLRPDGSSGEQVNIAEAAENLGYAGGVNAWLRPLLS